MRNQVVARVRRSLGGDAFPGVLLMGSTLLALLWANSVAAPMYRSLWEAPLSLGLGDLSLTKPLLLWVNDGLMAIFFLFVGLEIKREVVEGELSSWRQAALPLAAAVGGMLVPALLYLSVAGGTPAARGWGVPMATDIAFALGVLAVLGTRAPLSLKVFLTAVAIVDDLGAVAVIALFYTEQISVQALIVAAGLTVALWSMNRGGVRRLAPYLLVGAVLWVAVLKSGVHATVAGVVLAAMIPLARKGDHSPLVELEHALKPWALMLIVPVFALANAGVALNGFEEGGSAGSTAAMWGIMLGLVIGKPIGIVGLSWLAVRMNWTALPAGMAWGHVWAAGMLAGIGFTMSMFIGQLAFASGPVLEAAKLGILGGSALSMGGAAVMLQRATRAPVTVPVRRRPDIQPAPPAPWLDAA